MRAVQKSRRGVMLAEKQEWFARVIAQRVSNSEACRIVGINRRTGTRWRYGRTILNSALQAGNGARRALSAGETHSAQGAASSLSVADRAHDYR